MFKNISRFTKSKTSILLSVLAMPSILVAQAIPFDAEFDAEPNPIFTPYDAKTYPGISCEAQAVSEIDQFLNVAFDMANADPGKRNVVCPIVRDNTTNIDGTLGVYVHVYNTANRTLECSLFSLDEFGVIIDSDIDSTSSAGDRTIYLDVDSSVEGGFYGINCKLPNGAAVRSYEVREYLETNNDNGFLQTP